MSEQKQQPIISIDHVSMRFNLAKEKHESLKEYFVALLHGGVRFDEFFALSDVSFDIMPGDFYGLIGLNGSGKSSKRCRGRVHPVRQFQEGRQGRWRDEPAEHAGRKNLPFRGREGDNRRAGRQ